MKVLVKMPYSPYSGYGNDGIGLVTALERAGVDVYLQPTHIDPPLPQNIANMLTKRLDPPFDIILVHTDPGQLEVTPQQRAATDCLVGWSMWEFESFDNMVPSCKKTLRTRLSNLDAFLAYDEVTSMAIKPYLNKKTTLLQLQGGYDPSPWAYNEERDWFDEEKFVFIMVGQLHARKDPFVAIQAFRSLKEKYPEFETAQLHLKTTVAGLHPMMEKWTPGLRIHYKTWPTEILAQFYANTHCLLAPSRGEGKNVPALEMLSTGGTVIATNWGGHRGWLTPEIGYPLDYILMPEDQSPKMAECLSARASQEHLEELMWHVFTHRDEAKQKGALAAKLIPQMMNWDAVVERMFLQLKQVPGIGEQIYSASRML